MRPARIILTLVSLASALPLAAERRDVQLRFAVDDPRPLAAVADQLQQRYGWIVTFEEAPIVFPPDIEDVGPKVRRTPGPPVLVARSRAFTFSYDGALGASNAGAVVRALVEQYNQGDSANAKYTTRESRGMIHIVPLEFRDDDGQFKPFVPLLDRRISLPGGLNTVGVAEQAINTALRDAGISATLGVRGNLIQARTSGMALDGPARSVILDVLASTGGRYSLRTLCQPGIPTCHINVVVVSR